MLNTVKKSQDFYENRPWLTFLVLVTLGTMVLAVCSLLLGCGSDSIPGEVVKGKNASSVTPKKAGQSQVVMPVLLDQGNGAGGTKLPTRPPDAKVKDFFPQANFTEIEAKAAADRKKLSAPGNEILPGITAKEIEAKAAADRQKLLAPGNEIFPGITAKDIEAKMAADRQMHDPKLMMQQFKEVMARNQAKPKNQKKAAP